LRFPKNDVLLNVIFIVLPYIFNQIYNMKRSAALFLLLAVRFCAFAQTNSPAERCASDELRDAFIFHHPHAIHTIAREEAQMAAWIADNSSNLQIRQPTPVPVVVHIVWRDTSENVSDARVQSQIEALNRDFTMLQNAAKIPDLFKNIVARPNIQFCLAISDPDGRPTKGITRTHTEATYAGLRRLPNTKLAIGNTDGGGHTAWDTKHYLNIWVAHLGDFAGQASFPAMRDSMGFEGVVIDPRYFGTVGSVLKNKPYHLGKTATHEVGHFLNLCHIWGCVGAQRSCDDDDGVEDTPRQELPNYNCPKYPHASCTASDMFMNYMDTVNDTCMLSFTKQQSARMMATLNTVRSGLLNSSGCNPPTKPALTACTLDFRFFQLPARQMLKFIPIAACDSVVQLTLYNAIGQQVLAWSVAPNQEIAFDVSGYSSGIYFLTMQVKGERTVAKVMIDNF
jgi:Pregnancy-associated plasma protein-A/Secretion system C-terminal sorting domain